MKSPVAKFLKSLSRMGVVYIGKAKKKRKGSTPLSELRLLRHSSFNDFKISNGQIFQNMHFKIAKIGKASIKIFI